MTKQSKKLLVLSAIALTPITVGLTQAPASALTLYLRNINFIDGGTAKGSFDYNVATNQISNSNITTTASTQAPLAFSSSFTYAPPVGTLAPTSVLFANTNDRLFLFGTNNPLRGLAIFLQSAVTNNAPATFAVASVFEGNISNVASVLTQMGGAATAQAGLRFTKTGQLVNPVPEPEDILGSGVALGFLWLFGKTYYKKNKLKSVAKV